MGISSIGIGSGLKVSDIISQMVALEKKPLENLQARAQGIQAQVSTYSQIKSLTSTLADAAAKLTRDSGWNALTINSSSPAVGMTVSGLAQAGTFDIGVKQLARAQTSVTADAYPVDGKLGTAGTLQLTPHSGAAVDIEYGADDTLTTLAGKINEAATGVTATVMRDASGERLMLRSKQTGADAAFTVGGLDFSLSQSAQNARITLNGVAQESATDNFENVLPGLKIAANQVTADDARVTVAGDRDATRKNIQSFVDAYNALNGLLASSTKYDAETKVSGVLQGDSATLGLQNSLRMLTMSTAGNAEGAFKRLADVGIELQSGGALKIADPAKLDKALESPEAIKSLFAAKASGDGSGGGIAINFKQFTDKLLAFDGTLNNKSDALAKRVNSNLDEQTRVNQRAVVLEQRLTRQYTALDAKMASLSALGAYMEQQVAGWNKNSK